MQNPNEDTEWNDVLRQKGIIPPKGPEVTEEDIVQMMEKTIDDKSKGKEYGDMNLDELDDLEDEIDEEEERIFAEYRRKRIAELQEKSKKSIFGSVREISRDEYVSEVNKAGEGIWVVLHIYKDSIPLCKLVNQHLIQLARKFPATKFLRSVSDVCIPNYPDKNLPSLFIYHEDSMKKQLVGPMVFGGMNLTCDELEWMLSETGAVVTELEENPRKQVRDVMSSSIFSSAATHDDDDNDW